MLHSFTRIVVLASLAIGSVHAVEIHKCTDAEGRVTFSQQRCEGAEVSTIDLEVLPATGAGRPAIGSSADYQAVTQRIADRMTNLKIRNAEKRIDELTRERDDKLVEYQVQMTRDGDAVSGYGRAQQYSQLVSTTRSTYNDRIAAKQAEIDALKGQLHKGDEEPDPAAEPAAQ